MVSIICIEITFRERMGYTIMKLPGVGAEAFALPVKKVT
jgi:hypothetical protein